MDTTLLYLLFQEYGDQARGVSKDYICGKEFPLDDGKTIDGIIKSYVDLMDFFSYENLQFLYDEENKKGLLFQSSVLGNIYPGPEICLNAAFKEHGVTDWEDIDSFGERLECALYGKDITNDMLGDIASRNIIREKARKNKSPLNAPSALVSIDALKEKTEDLEIATRYDGSCKIKVIRGKKELHQWLIENHCPEKVYHYNPKHGDDNHQSQIVYDKNGSHRAAQLLTNKDDTQNLLNRAVGRNKEDELWFFDDKNQKYIYFKYENVNQPAYIYHGYHLNPGEVDYERIDIAKIGDVLDK